MKTVVIPSSKTEQSYFDHFLFWSCECVNLSGGRFQNNQIWRSESKAQTLALANLIPNIGFRDCA